MEKFKSIDDVAVNFAKEAADLNLTPEIAGIAIEGAVLLGAKEIWQQLETMDFGNAIRALKAGKVMRRKIWARVGIVVFKQVPANISEEIIPKMQSLPDDAKQLILKNPGHISYRSQCLAYCLSNGNADSWTPTIDDVFAEDWQVVE